MATVILGTNVRIQVQKTLGGALTISGITKASPGVVTSTSHGLSNGDYVIFSVSGMVELDGQIGRVSAVTTNTFEIEGEDTTSYSTFTSGTCKKITAWDTLGNARSLEAAQGAPNRIETTTLTDTERQYVFGLPDSPQITVQGLADPTGVANATIRTASRANAAIAVLASFGSGLKLAFNSYVSGGDAFSLAVNDVGSTRYDFTQIKRRNFYAS